MAFRTASSSITCAIRAFSAIARASVSVTAAASTAACRAVGSVRLGLDTLLLLKLQTLAFNTPLFTSGGNGCARPALPS
ncbi:hypothetical protein ASE60_32665 [Ensifer sp. Root278]|nr:hypothetical protein ASE60_32665 [Ensifer sp. Root278]